MLMIPKELTVGKDAGGVLWRIATCKTAIEHFPKLNTKISQKDTEGYTPPLCMPESLLVCVHPQRCTVEIYRPAKLPKVHLASSAYVVVFASCLGHGHFHHFKHLYDASQSKVVQDLGMSGMYQ